MTILSPGILFWLIGAGLPPLLWWLFRRRKRVVEWSANYVLRQVLEDTGQRNIWRQIVILALRVLAIAAIVLAFARAALPRQPDPGTLAHGDGVLHQIVLVDNSASMRTPYEAVTRADELHSRLAPLLQRLRHGDHCQVIPLAPLPGARLEAVDVGCPLAGDALASLRRQLPLRPIRAALLDGLQLAAERFHDTSSSNRQLIILSDLSAEDRPGHQYEGHLAAVFDQLAVRRVAYEIRDRPRPNLTVRDVHTGADQWFAGWQYHVYLDVENNSREEAAASLQIRLQYDDRQLQHDVLPVNLKAGERRFVDYRVTAPEIDGLLVLEVTVDDGSFADDNYRRRQIYVTPRAEILFVHGGSETADSVLWQESYYLRAAVEALSRPKGASGGPVKSGWAFVRDPQTGEVRQVNNAAAAAASESTRPQFALQTRQIAAAEVTPADLDSADAVVLVDVSELPVSIPEALARFVRRGGGVLIGMGEHVYSDTFNAGIGAALQVELGSRHVERQRNRADWDYDAPHQLIERTFDHALLRPYLDEKEGPIQNVRVYNYFQVLSPGKALMTLSSGDPLLLETALGRGVVLLYTASLGGSWQTFPVRNMYTNFVYAWLTRICAFRKLPRNLAPDQPLILQADYEPSVVEPGSSTPRSLQPKIVDDQRFFRYDLSRPGRHLILAEGQEKFSVDAHALLPESKSLPLLAADRDSFSRNLDCPVESQWSAVVTDLAVDENVGLELTGWLAALMLVLLLADAGLTRRWWVR